MKSLMKHTRQSKGDSCFRLRLVPATLLVACMVTVVQSQEPTPIYDTMSFNDIRNNPRGYYRLTSDIYLNESYPFWTPVGNRTHPFRQGSLDGQGYSIYGLNATTETENTPTGLFGVLEDSRVHNLTLVRPYVESKGHNSPAGALAGEIIGSNVTACVTLSGQVRSLDNGTIADNFFHSSPAGGLAGLSKDRSIVSYNLNTGSVNTSAVRADAGGLVGRQTSGSTVSHNLNTGPVSTHGDEAAAGGVVGQQMDDSIASHNLNTGPVNTHGCMADASGVVGQQMNNSIASNNLNAGPVSSNGEQANSGGVMGQQLRSAASHNLNTGPVNSNRNAGGMVGEQTSSTASHNLNTGSVSSSQDCAGGTVGEQTSSTASHNLNTGSVNGDNAGGTVGCQFQSTASHNLNTGLVNSNRNAGGIVGFQRRIGTTIHNLNIGPVKGAWAWSGGIVGIQQVSSTTSHNLNTGPVDANGVSVNAAVGHQLFNSIATHNLNAGQGGNDIQINQAGLHGLNSSFWFPGDQNTFPMLRGINPAYRDLQRINGTRYGNNDFPNKLGMFADPGGTMDDSLLDCTAWNLMDGYLPFLQGISPEQAEAAGIDCTPGGFACEQDCFSDPFPANRIHKLPVV